MQSASLVFVATKKEAEEFAAGYNTHSDASTQLGLNVELKA